jgi:hypothetical protein
MNAEYVERLPGQFAIYKGMGAAQFNLILPKYREFTRNDGTKAERIDMPGGVLLEMAASLGKRSYDWKNKVNINIGMTDLNLWMADPYNGVELFHDTPGRPDKKKLSVKPGQKSGFMLTLRNTHTDVSVTVPMSEGEYEVLIRLLIAAAPTFIGWL